MQTLFHRLFFFLRSHFSRRNKNHLEVTPLSFGQYAAQHYLHPDQSLQDHTDTVANIGIHSQTDHQSLDHNTPDHNNTPPNHESPIHNTSITTTITLTTRVLSTTHLRTLIRTSTSLDHNTPRESHPSAFKARNNQNHNFIKDRIEQNLNKINTYLCLTRFSRELKRTLLTFSFTLDLNTKQISGENSCHPLLSPMSFPY